MGNAVAIKAAERRTLAREVREYRTAHGLSRAEMAQVMGCSLRTVVNMETGAAGLAPQTVRAWGRLREAWRATEAHSQTRTYTLPDTTVEMAAISVRVNFDEGEL